MVDVNSVGNRENVRTDMVLKGRSRMVNPSKTKLLISKTVNLFPIPRNLVLVGCKFFDSWRFPVMGFFEQNKKIYFIVGAWRYYVGMRITRYE